MKTDKRQPLENDELVVKITRGSGEEKDVIIRSKHQTMKLAGHKYARFEIIQPRGYENQEIVHRLSRGYEELVASVFLALAEPRITKRSKALSGPDQSPRPSCRRAIPSERL